MMVDIPDNVLWIAAINNGVQFTGTTDVGSGADGSLRPAQDGLPADEEEVRILAGTPPGRPPPQIERR